MEREKIGGEFGKFGGYSGDLEKIRKMIMLVENRGGEAVTIGFFGDHSVYRGISATGSTFNLHILKESFKFV